ncbi:elongation factor 4, partial [Enterococcus faecalis]
SPKPIARDYLMVGDVGYITASIKTVPDTRVGDTVTLAVNPAAEALPGYRKLNPKVYCEKFPCVTSRFNNFREALEK